MAQLGLLGYVDGVDIEARAVGVRRWDPARAEGGWNLYCSGHGAEAILMGMDGEVAHRWAYAYDNLPGQGPPTERHQGAWRRVRLLPGGSLLAIHEGLSIVRVDRDSRLEWFRRNGAHHDLDVDVDGAGHVFVLTQEESRIPKLSTKAPILEDWIEELDRGGRLIRKVSLLRAVWNSAWAPLLQESARDGGDVLHANTLEILREEPRVPHTAFRPGAILVAFREIDAVAVVDLDRQVVTWLKRGPWVRPHQPTVLPDGSLLVFDNMGNQGYSRVVAYDVEKDAVVWEYAGDPPASLFSIFSGSVQRLPGGNTLVTESYAGRAFEVTRDGRIVWEFASPHRAGDHGELVAVLFDVVRLPSDMPLYWLH